MIRVGRLRPRELKEGRRIHSVRRAALRGRGVSGPDPCTAAELLKQRRAERPAARVDVELFPRSRRLSNRLPPACVQKAIDYTIRQFVNYTNPPFCDQIRLAISHHESGGTRPELHFFSGRGSMRSLADGLKSCTNCKQPRRPADLDQNATDATSRRGIDRSPSP